MSYNETLPGKIETTTETPKFHHCHTDRLAHINRLRELLIGEKVSNGTKGAADQKLS